MDSPLGRGIIGGMLSLKLVRGAEHAEGVRPVVNVPPDAAKFVIGRDPGCDWHIADRQLALSGRHCEIVRIEGRQVLRDTSTNGTFVNGARERLPAEHVLRHGDRVELGGFQFEVSVVPDALGAATHPAAPGAAALPRRGGDPAAMVAADWEQAPVRAGSAPVDAKSALTRINKPPPKAVLDELLAAAKAGAATPAREAAWRAPPGTPDVLQRLAGGLGVPVEALGSSDPAVAAERVARLLRRAVLALHHQLGLQEQQLHEMGSRTSGGTPNSEAAQLRKAQGPEEAIQALLAAGDKAGAVLVVAHSELGQHMQRLLAAFAAAGQRLGEQLDPAAVERVGQGADDPARLWKIYGSLWTALGVGVGKPWQQGLAEALATYLAAAYDDTKLPERGAPEKAVR